MPEGFKNPDFLKKFPGLGGAEEVIAAKTRTEKRTGQKVKGDFASLIQNYLDRFTEHRDNLAEMEDGRVKERAIERTKAIIADKFITKYENIPEAYWREKDENGDMGTFYRELYERGLSGDWAKMSDEEKEKYKQDYAKTLIEDQRDSLEEWLDYFIDKDLSGDIPDYLKYWVFRSLTSLQEYEKPKDWNKENLKQSVQPSEREESIQEPEEKRLVGQFPRRAKNSLKKFPDLHPEALRYVIDALVAKHQGKNHDFGYDISEEERATFKQYLEQESFAKLYAWAMESFNPIPEELLPITEGQWVKYPQGSDVNEVTKTLKGKGTGLCIAGKGAAGNYLNTGDLHIFYSNDQDGNPTFPRIAIHAKGEEIAEVRGIAQKQNLDPFMGEVASAKLSEFANGKSYESKTEDMRRLTEIENKTKQNQPLTKSDLLFLYEAEAPIRYFGMNKDPRIKELLAKRDILEDIKVIYDYDFNNPNKEALEFIYNVGKQPAPSVFLATIKELRQNRNLESDMLIIFECEISQIIHNQTELRQAIKDEREIKAYVGELFPNIFKLLPNTLEHIYTEFPEGKIRQKTIELGTGLKSKDDFEAAITNQGSQTSDWAKDIMSKPEFKISKEEANENLVILSVKTLGFPNGATVQEIFDQAKKLGLELCPAETGPQLLLQYPEQPMNEWCLIGMNPITDSDGHPKLFRVGRYGDGPWLHAGDGRPDDRCPSGYRFAFVRK